MAECLPTPGPYQVLRSRDNSGYPNWVEEGEWRVIPSSRHYVEWYGGTDFTLRDLHDGLKSAKRWGYVRHRVVRSALDYVK